MVHVTDTVLPRLVIACHCRKAVCVYKLHRPSWPSHKAYQCIQAEEEAATIAGSVRSSICGSVAASVREAQHQQHIGSASPVSPMGTGDVPPSHLPSPGRCHRAGSQLGKGITSSVVKADQPTSIAATFCGEVRTQIHKLQTEVQKRNASIANLHVQIQRQETQHKYARKPVGFLKHISVHVHEYAYFVHEMMGTSPVCLCTGRQWLQNKPSSMLQLKINVKSPKPPCSATLT
jgi:hypothetical protein